MTQTANTAVEIMSPKGWPAIFDRYVKTLPEGSTEHLPRRTNRKYHGRDVTVWYGRVHIDDVGGWVENIRMKHYLNRWRARLNDNSRRPTTEEIYEIMIEADDEERSQSKKPFHLDRMAANIVTNGVQESIFVHINADGRGILWDGNRRRYGTQHIMISDKFRGSRDQAQWLPAYVHLPEGDPAIDEEIKRRVLTELNFKLKDHIPWPAYVKAEEVHRLYHNLVAEDPADSTLRRRVKQQLAEEFGLSGWRQADRWIKMYDLAGMFKEYHEEDHDRTEVEVDLQIQDRFEYFDELSKPGVWGVLEDDPDSRDKVFDWLWDGKFKSFADVRSVPRILADPEALRHAEAEDQNSVKRAIETVISNDPVRVKDKSAANERIAHFAAWLNSFKREDYLTLHPETLEHLHSISADTAKILAGLTSPEA